MKIIFRHPLARMPFFLLVIFGAWPGLCHAQDPFAKPNQGIKYFNKTEAGIGIGLGHFKADIYYGIQKTLKNDQITVSIQTINGILISGRAGLGVGLGAEFWQKGMFYPVFGHLFYDFSPKENTLFASISVGQAFGHRDSTYYYASGKGGLMFGLSFGYKMKIGKRFQFEYEILYRYQAVLSTYQTYYTGADSLTHHTTTDYKVPYHFAGFRIGVLFH
jgi:hypothetical protein